MKYPTPKVIAVDVDGTLITNGVINEKLVRWCKKQSKLGFTMILWSSRGLQHALKAAELTGLSNTFDHVLSKPGIIVDDKGWGWVKYTKVLNHLHVGS